MSLIQAQKSAEQRSVDLGALPPLLTPEEAAEVLRLTSGHVLRLCRRGEMEHTRYGRWVRIPRRVVLRAAGYDEAEIFGASGGGKQR